MRPNTAALDGLRIWNADPLLRPGLDVMHGDPFEPLRPVRLMAPIGGLSSGQIVISGPVSLENVSAEVSDFTSVGGETIDKHSIRVRYAKPFGKERFIALHDRPAGDATIRPVWITVNVPSDAVAGKYTATLSVRVADKSFDVPLDLTVFGWRIGEPKDWHTFVNLLQSPESVAGHYKVPLWSDRHFKLMENSMRLMGEAGNNLLGISAVGKSVFGDDPMIVFRRQGNKYVADMRFAQRYLRQYDRLAGEPKFLSLNVWSYGMYQRGAGRDGGKVEQRAETIPVVELRGDQLVSIEIPIYGEPGTAELWRQVTDGLQGTVAELGWREDCLLLGTSGDAWPSPITVAMFKKIAPNVRWRAITHGNGVPNWGPSDADRTQPNGMVVGYLELVRRLADVAM